LDSFVAGIFASRRHPEVFGSVVQWVSVDVVNLKRIRVSAVMQCVDDPVSHEGNLVDLHGKENGSISAFAL
jgi:hypothetical protein